MTSERKELDRFKLIDGTSIVIGENWTQIFGRGIDVYGESQEDQIRTAYDLGYVGDVNAMTRDHDPLHVILACALRYGPSYSLRYATERANGAVTPESRIHLGKLEEAAVMALQAVIRAHGLTARDVAYRFGVLAP